MGKHLCEICKKEFKKKCNLISHQNRKYPCKLREYNEKGELCIVNSENLIYSSSDIFKAIYIDNREWVEEIKKSIESSSQAL